eukprot:PhM_4_TR16954/c0_g1_i1/m.74447
MDDDDDAVFHTGVNVDSDNENDNHNNNNNSVGDDDDECKFSIVVDLRVLVRAAYDGDTEAVRMGVRALDGTGDISQVNDLVRLFPKKSDGAVYGRVNVLLAACLGLRKDVLIVLMNTHGVDIRCKNDAGLTPVRAVIRVADRAPRDVAESALECVKLLLTYGALLEYDDWRGPKLTSSCAEWVPDAGVAACTRCGGAFDFLNRRHHCRCCGAVVCDTCAPYRDDARMCFPYCFTITQLWKARRVLNSLVL